MSYGANDLFLLGRVTWSIYLAMDSYWTQYHWHPEGCFLIRTIDSALIRVEQ